MSPAPGSRNEREYLQGLLDTFGAPDAPAIDAAEARLQLAFDLLMNLVETPGKAHSLILEPEQFSELAREFHRRLYSGLLINAGAFRSTADEGGGYVGFGGQYRQENRARYTGAAPAQIEALLLDGFGLLKGSEDPVEASILAYQRFVRVHPFYDANGRIGRLIVTFYLVQNGFYPDWQHLDTHRGKFIQKLNAVHDRPLTGHTRKEYEALLVGFWRKHVSPISEFYHGGEDVPPLTEQSAVEVTLHDTLERLGGRISRIRSAFRRWRLGGKR